MIIKRVECEQFAGLSGREVEFEKGLNLIVGKNECGKSTIVDLIFQILFQDAKVDKRSDSAFIERYFPKKVKGNSGDFIDGVLVFETENGRYKLKKEWEPGAGGCKLTLPDGTVIKGIDKINQVLSEELPHRAGVFSEIVFASQKRAQLAVESIMKTLTSKKEPFSGVREQLASTLTKAVLETGGVSLETLEKKLAEKIESLGKRWDVRSDAPEGGNSKASYKNAWSLGKDSISITKAYYEWDEVRVEYEMAEATERRIEAAKARLKEMKEELNKKREKREEFRTFSELLRRYALLKKSIADAEKRIAEQKKALEEWPIAIENKKKAEKLKKALELAKKKALYDKISKAREAYLEKKTELDKLKEVDPEDEKNLGKQLRIKDLAESKLAGMNLAAKISQLGDIEIQVTSLVSDAELIAEDGTYAITEATKIFIPGIMEMQLTPKGVDVAELKESINTAEAQIKIIKEKYGITTPEELRSLAKKYSETKNEVEKRKQVYESYLGNLTWETVEAEEKAFPGDLESVEELTKQQIDICKNISLDAFIGGVDTKIKGYEDNYSSMETLKEKLANEEKEKQKNLKDFDSMDEIPEEYKGIRDTDLYDNRLKNEIELLEKQIEEQEKVIHSDEKELKDKTADEYAEEMRQKETVLQSRKEEYQHWLNIEKVFRKLKENSSGNSSEDIAKRFNEYLDIISDGGLKVQGMDDKMVTQLSSGANALTYDILSEGSRDTISLAFRLAMLEHLYPDGDGLAVFDDPFTDMDPVRRSKACALIQKFAEKNQVIFTTCDDIYCGLLEGNVIRIS